MRYPFLNAFALVACAWRVSAQMPVTTLGKSLGRSSEGFTEIGGLHEFADGRVVVVDFRENRTVMLDFARTTARNLTRTGDGPNELPLVLTIVPWFGDTVLVGGHQHTLTVAPTGEIVGKTAVAFAQLGSHSAPMYADRQGRLYGTTMDPVKQDAKGEFIAPLGGTVLRVDPRTSRMDSLVRLSYRDPKQILGKPWRPYPKHDAFAVLATGDVMVFRAQGYVAEVWRDGKLVTSKPVPDYTPIPIGAAERDAYRDEKTRPSGSGGSSRGANMGAMGDADRAAARRALDISDDIFPPTLSPFLEVNPAVVDRATGHTWVARSFAVKATDRLYDVFDEHATLIRRVVIKNRGKVLGFGNGVVYVGYPDDDDVLWVEKVALK